MMREAEIRSVMMRIQAQAEQHWAVMRDGESRQMLECMAAEIDRLLIERGG